MNKITFIIAIFIGFTAFGQEEANENIQEKGSQEPEIGCIIWPEDIKVRPLAFSADDYFRAQILPNNYETNINVFGSPNGSMPLSKDLPFVHTIRGAVYTADYLKYTPRY